MNIIPDDILQTANAAWKLRANECKESVAEAIFAERERCLKLTLEFATRRREDIFDTLIGFTMEELAEHIRCGDTKIRARPDNDNDDTVMK